MQLRSLTEWYPHWLSHIQKNQSIGFVPTMGALHEGHLDLVARCLSEKDITLVSIFVNPTQFTNQEDFQNYPITLEADMEKLKSVGVNYVFIPEVHTIYPTQPTLKFNFGDLEHVLEGKFRPGHFNGVGIIVAKLFHMIKPNTAYFGQKDLQQVAIVKRLVKDLSFDLEIEVVPTRRDSDGLALSSRNLRLSLEEKKTALILFQSLNFAKKELTEGSPWQEIKDRIEEFFFQKKEAHLEYIELVNPDTFEQYLEFDPKSKSFLCISAYIGPVRLIDNLEIIP